MSPRSSQSGRERLVDAAERVILEQGPGQLSVEAVIRAAGLSKGAFFHHFASKDALLLAIIERLQRELEGRLQERAATRGSQRGRRLRAQIEMTFDDQPRQRARLKALLLAIIEGAVSGSAFVKAARRANQHELRANLRDDVPVGESLVVHFALDGYWLNECLGGVALAPAERTALRDSLRRLSRTRPPKRKEPQPR
jgi:AcrR family transcriptional regulator